MKSERRRLDQWVAEASGLSRKEAKEAIRVGRVTVDGRVCRQAEQKVEPGNRVALSGKELFLSGNVYVMLHKPSGVVSATEDARERTVLDLVREAKELPEEVRRAELFPVGRLDKDAEGLLLLTNDGALAHRLLSPRRHVDKVYEVCLSGRLPDDAAERFAAGLPVGTDYVALPAGLDVLEASDAGARVRITLREGRFHQIKRMCHELGCEVVSLKRLSMGTLVLDAGLPRGKARLLTGPELRRLTQTEESCAISAQDGGDGIRKDRREGMLRGKKAVIFDLDGTLVDSMWMWKRIDEEYLEKFGIPLPATLHQEIAGMSFTETAAYFKERFQLPDSVEKMKQDWNDMAREKYTHEVPLKPGVAEFLRFLKENGIRTGIATSNSAELLSAVLTSLGIRDCFDEIHTACEVEKGKPAPDIYLYVAECLGVLPSECLVFEDIPEGIQAGKAAGMEVCAVEDEASAQLRGCKRELADYYIEDYREIL